MAEEYKVVNSEEHLLSLLLKKERWTSLYRYSDKAKYDLEFTNCHFSFEFNYDTLKKIIKRVDRDKIFGRPQNLKFNRCRFLEDLKIKDQIIAKNKPLDPTQTNQFENYQLDLCYVSLLNIPGARFSGKLRFMRCTFDHINLHNTKFEDLADFWRCTFNSPVIFYKTDFLGTTVFSGSTFKRPVLFTYSLIEKLIIFRGTKFNEGLDLSLAIIPGEISCFDIQLGYFNTAKRIKRLDEGLYEQQYEEAVSDNAQIPVNNARETYRILKQTLVSQDNVSDSIRFKVLEKRKLFIETIHKFQYKSVLHFFHPRTLVRTVHNIFEIINLGLNAISNGFGTSYLLSLIFVAAFGWLFFNLSLGSIDPSLSQFNPMKADEHILRFFPQFLLPSHKFNYLGLGNDLPMWFYVHDFLGRLFVGYGIYQFIQAFRKYR